MKKLGVDNEPMLHRVRHAWRLNQVLSHNRAKNAQKQTLVPLLVHKKRLPTFDAWIA
jgi:hypothetical protein